MDLLTRRSFTRCASSITAGLFLTGSVNGSAKSAVPMNVLFLMTDQHRPDAIGCFGDPHAHTPTLDALASSGMSFRRTYCQNPVCVPARNSILLGRYSHSLGVFGNADKSKKNFQSIPQVLRSKGYLTACFGKLHVKGRDDLDWDVYDSGKSRKVKGAAESGVQKNPDGSGKLGVPDSGTKANTSEWYAKEKTISFMKRNHNKPWFIQCSMYKPHPPFEPPAQCWDAVDRKALVIPNYPKDDLDDANPALKKSMEKRHLADLCDEDIRDAMQGYYGNIRFIDEMLGDVLKALDELDLRDKTLIVFTSDHGEMLYDHRLWTKMNFFDSAVRVPLLMSFAGTIPAGVQTQALVEHIDLFPTIMDFLGFDTPDGVQGRSFYPLATGQKQTHRNFVRSEHWTNGHNGHMMMQFDGRYKVIDNGPDIKAEIYDIEQDPQEIHNRIDEPTLKAIAESVIADLRRWSKEDYVSPRS